MPDTRPEPPRCPVEPAALRKLVARIPETSTDPIMAVDETGNRLWSNAVMERTLAALGGDAPDHVLVQIVARAAEIGEAGTAGFAAVEDTSAGDDGTIMLVGADQRQSWFRISQWVIGDVAIIALHDVTQIKHREQNLREANSMVEHRLNHDPQTGLPNRRHLTAQLRTALRNQAPGRRVGVVVIELLNFDELTSLHGPDAAGEVLQDSCFALLECVDEDQIVARTGSREFVVVFERCSDLDSLRTHAMRIHRALQISVPLDTGDYAVSVRLALALAEPDQHDSDRLLIDPLVALHHPGLPRSQFIRIYDAQMRTGMENRAKIYAELKQAIENDEIEPFYQPQIRISDNAMIGFEVLARWRHPERGPTAPGLFLGIAEDTGLLPTIDDIIMRKSIRALAGWRCAGESGVRISLNASSEALRDPTFADRLAMELDRHDLTPEAVSIEILESVLIEDTNDTASATLARLKAAGVRLELDDFGTGYASISSLIRLKVDTVKLDRSLIEGLTTDGDCHTIVRSTLALAAQLGVESLAEGVENEAQMAILADLGCQYAQGFGIAKPMSEGHASAWLDTHRAGPAAHRAIA